MSVAARAVTPQEVALVDWEQKQTLARFRADQGTLKALALHPEARRVAAIGEKPVVKIWDAYSGKSLLDIPQEGQNLAFSGDGKLLIVGNGPQLTAFDSASGEVQWQREEADFHHPTLLRSEGDRLAWSAFGGHRVHILDARTGETQLTLGGADEVFAVAFHPDGRRFAVVVTTQNKRIPYNVQVWRLKKDEATVPDRELHIVNLAVAVAISPGGGTVATGDGQGAQLWDYASGGPERRLAERQSTKVPGLGTLQHPRTSLAAVLRFSADGQQVVTDGEYLRVWDAKSGDLLWTFTPG